MPIDEVAAVEEIIGYSFSDKQLLRRCITPSAESEWNNERLEFLGDAVIELVVTDYLYSLNSLTEGDMTKFRQALVSNKTLYEVVKELSLDRFVHTEGKKPVASLFEAICGGVYLDGGFKAAEKIVKTTLLRADRTEKLLRSDADEENYKGKLQEYLQSQGLGLPDYALIEKKGPDHAPKFIVSASSNGKTELGTGESKAQAEQRAAKALLHALGEK